ncbi:MAG: amidohydrolase family protein, partial [Tepidisphaeraceae bacterium]
HRESPEVEPGEIWELATIRGARALGLSGVCGLLSPGFDADITAFPVSGNDPLKEILETEVLPLSVWISGEQTFASR